MRIITGGTIETERCGSTITIQEALILTTTDRQVGSDRKIGVTIIIIIIAGTRTTGITGHNLTTIGVSNKQGLRNRTTEEGPKVPSNQDPKAIPVYNGALLEEVAQVLDEITCAREHNQTDQDLDATS